MHNVYNSGHVPAPILIVVQGFCVIFVEVSIPWKSNGHSLSYMKQTGLTVELIYFINLNLLNTGMGRYWGNSIFWSPWSSSWRSSSLSQEGLRWFQPKIQLGWV